DQILSRPSWENYAGSARKVRRRHARSTFWNLTSRQPAQRRKTEHPDRANTRSGRNRFVWNGTPVLCPATPVLQEMELCVPAGSLELSNLERELDRRADQARHEI